MVSSVSACDRFNKLERGGRVYHVTWRGWMLERLPSGLVVRNYVYRLDNGLGDCYHQDELTDAWQWD
jgi:hypothetical protein